MPVKNNNKIILLAVFLILIVITARAQTSRYITPAVTGLRNGISSVNAYNSPGFVFTLFKTRTNSPDFSRSLLHNNNDQVTSSLISKASCIATPMVMSNSKKISAGPKLIITFDTTVCANTSFQLQSADMLTYQWTPSQGLNNPGIGNPIFTAGSVSGINTYLLTATNYSDNLVINGDFEQGNTGFFTNYIYCNTGNCLFPLANDGYSVGTDANYFHNLFSGHDHTTGKGNFMIINGADPTRTVWREIINVTPNTSYAFGCWISTMISLNTAQIRFSINGTQLGPIYNAPSIINSWNQFFISWNSGPNTSATIEIVDVLNQSNGNDFGLDDIFFGQINSYTDSIHIKTIAPTVKNISASLCTGQNYTLPSGAVVNKAGIYKDTVRSSGGCDSLITTVNLNLIAPQLKTINASVCAGENYTLPSGAVVNKAGIYKDTVRSLGGCDSIITTVNFSVYKGPSIKNISVKICSSQLYTLPSGVMVSKSGVYKDTLKSSAGCDSAITILDLSVYETPLQKNISESICEGQTYQLPWGEVVYEGGNYSDTLRNIAGCDSIINSVTLTTHSAPNVEIAKSGDINCVSGTSTLSAQNGITYEWWPSSSLNNDSIADPLASPAVTTMYYVKIKDIYGCTNEDSIEVKVNTAQSDNQYLVPTAFTPNGDGLNDCFGIKEWGVVSDLDFSIYNRWGILVFHTNDPSRCWDGTYKGEPQNSGIFVCIIKAKTTCGNIYRKGTVLLIR